MGRQADAIAGVKIRTALPGNIRAMTADVNQDHDDGMAVVQAEDIENGEYNCSQNTMRCCLTLHVRHRVRLPSYYRKPRYAVSRPMVAQNLNLLFTVGVTLTLDFE